MTKFTTVEGEEIQVNPKLCASISHKKNAQVWLWDHKGKCRIKHMDIVVLYMSGGQHWRIKTQNFNTHAFPFHADKFPQISE